jgi:hypothetical protein
MNIIPYKAEHLTMLMLQPSQGEARKYLGNPEYGRHLDVPGLAFTAMEGGEVLAMAGVMPRWEGRAEAWALLSGDLKRHFVRIHRAVLRFLETSDIRRIETAVDANFQAGIAWAEMLGFQNEGMMRGYTPEGRDCYRFARVKGA